MPISSPSIQDKFVPSVQTCSYSSFGGYELALFPGLPTVQFLITCSVQERMGRPGIFYHVNNVSVSRQRGRGGKAWERG